MSDQAPKKAFPLPRTRMAVGGIGQKLPPEHQRLVDQGQLVDKFHRQLGGVGPHTLSLHPDQYPDMPAWAIGLMNEVRQLSVHTMAMKTILESRGLITEKEWMDAIVAINASAEEQVRQMLGQLGRQFGQDASQVGMDIRCPQCGEATSLRPTRERYQIQCMNCQHKWKTQETS